MQLVDELSMIYTTCVMCFATFTYRRSNLFSAFLGLALIALAAFITVQSESGIRPPDHAAHFQIRHVGVLSHLKRSPVPSKLLWYLDSNCSTPQCLCHGDRAPTETPCPRSCQSQAYPGNHVVDGRYRAHGVSWRILHLESG